VGTPGPLRDIRDFANARQVLRALAQSRMDEQYAEIQALEARFKGTRIVHALTDSLARDEWSDLVMAGRGVRFYVNQAAAAAQFATVEVGNGLAVGLPTGKLVLVKRIRCNNAGGAATSYNLALDASATSYLTATVVGLTVCRYFDSSIEPVANLGTMPRYFPGGNSGVNCRSGAPANPIVSGLQIDNKPQLAGGEAVFDIPSGWYQALLDGQAGENPRVLRAWNTTVNQTMVATIECVEVPFDYF